MTQLILAEIITVAVEAQVQMAQPAAPSLPFKAHESSQAGIAVWLFNGVLWSFYLAHW